MRLYVSTLLLALLFAATSPAAPPKGPPTVKVGVGQIVSVEVEAYVEKDGDKEIVKAVCWAPGFPAESVYLDEGKPHRAKTARFIISPKKPGVHRIVLWSQGDGPGEYSTLVIDADGVAPTPPTPPKPVPPGPLPDGAFGLRKVSREAVPVNSRGWDRLAGTIRSHASAVAAGAAGIKNGKFDPATLLAELGSKNVAALTAEELKAWESWDKAVMKAFYAAYTGGKLAAKSDWVDALNAIADGLED